MKICGISCAMNSHTILAASIKHLFLNGISDFYLYDHASDPDLSSFLSTEFVPGTIRVQVLRKETRLFFQREMVNVLADLAREDGFEIAVAFDADEFWCSTVQGRSLTDQIAFEISSDVDALRVPVVNYVQHRDVDTFDVDSLSRCQYSVVPFVDPTRHPQAQVDAGMPFVAMPFPSKVIAWLSRDSKFVTGQHSLTKTNGEVRIIEATGILVRHLPLPFRKQMGERREQGLRLVAAGLSPWLGWQSQRLANMTDDELEAYWRNNSWHLAEGHRACVGSYDRLVLEDALVQIGQNLKQASQRLNQGLGEGAQASTTFREIPSSKLERAIQNLVDDYGQAERRIEALKIAHDQALAAADELALARDQAAAERDLVRSELDLLRSFPWPRIKALFNTLRPIEKRLREFRKRHFALHRSSQIAIRKEPGGSINWCLLQADNRALSLFHESKRLAYDAQGDSMEMMHNLNGGSLTQNWDYWSSSALINQLKCSLMQCEYRRITIAAQDHPERHITWGKIRILLDFLHEHPEVDIVAFLDSDAFVRDEARFKALVEVLAKNPDKHGVVSRDPLIPKNTFINTGCMIFKNDDFVKNLLESVWNDVNQRPQYRWEWPHEQYSASAQIEANKEAFYLCQTAVLNTPCGEIVRHCWWKDLFEELMVDELKSTVAKMLCDAPLPETTFNIDTLLDH
jgi:hypothetical protein